MPPHKVLWSIHHKACPLRLPQTQVGQGFHTGWAISSEAIFWWLKASELMQDQSNQVRTVLESMDPVQQYSGREGREEIESYNACKVLFATPCNNIQGWVKCLGQKLRKCVLENFRFRMPIYSMSKSFKMEVILSVIILHSKIITVFLPIIWF